MSTARSMAPPARARYQPDPDDSRYVIIPETGKRVLRKFKGHPRSSPSDAPRNDNPNPTSPAKPATKVKQEPKRTRDMSQNGYDSAVTLKARKTGRNQQRHHSQQVKNLQDRAPKAAHGAYLGSLIPKAHHDNRQLICELNKRTDASFLYDSNWAGGGRQEGNAMMKILGRRLYYNPANTLRPWEWKNKSQSWARLAARYGITAKPGDDFDTDEEEEAMVPKHMKFDRKIKAQPAQISATAPTSKITPHQATSADVTSRQKPSPTQPTFSISTAPDSTHGTLQDGTISLLDLPTTLRVAIMSNIFGDVLAWAGPKDLYDTVRILLRLSPDEEDWLETKRREHIGSIDLKQQKGIDEDAADWHYPSRVNHRDITQAMYAYNPAQALAWLQTEDTLAEVKPTELAQAIRYLQQRGFDTRKLDHWRLIEHVDGDEWREYVTNKMDVEF